MAATLAIFVTIAVLTGVTLGAYGLVLGQKRVSYQRIRNDPLLGCLWVGEPQLTEGKIDLSRMEKLNAEVRKRALGQSGFDGCWPFRLRVLQISTAAGSNEQVRCTGRTYLHTGPNNGPETADPILASLGVVLKETAQPGIVLTPGMLKRMGWSLVNIPPTIEARAGGTRLRLPVTAVSEKDLPYGLDFLIAENVDDVQIRQARAEHATEVISGIATEACSQPLKEMLKGKGPLAESWKLLIKQGVSGQYDDSTRQLILIVEDEKGRSRDDWSFALELIGNALVEWTGKPIGQFLELELTRPVPPSVNEDASKPYDMACLYFSNLALMSVAEPVVQEDELLKGLVDTSAIKQLSAADGRTKTALQVVSTFELMIGTMALVNLLVVQWFRAAWQRREAGMLRACGMRSGQLMLVALSQGSIIWLLGSNLGLAVGWSFGRWMAATQYQDSIEAALGFHAPMWLWLLASCLAWLLSCLTSLLCSLRSAIAEPAQLVDDV